MQVGDTPLKRAHALRDGERLRVGELCLAFRDARIVGDLLCEAEHWDEALFEPYVVERRDRLHRLRLTAHYATRLEARFDEASVEARARAMTRIAESSEFFPLIGAFAGPEHMPDALLADEFADRLFGP